MNNHYRSECPITITIDLLGDKWSLVIIKQMLLEKKQTFKEFIESEESISTNILSDRLKTLEEHDLIEKKSCTINKKINYYHLTEKGLSLTPILLEMLLWGSQNLCDIYEKQSESSTECLLNKEREEVIERLKEDYRQSIL